MPLQFGERGDGNLRHGNGILGGEGAEFGEFGGMLWFRGEIGPFVRIGGDVVELLVAVAVVNVAPGAGADGVLVGMAEVSDGGVRPFSVWIFQERHKAVRAHVFRCRDVAEVGQCAVEIDEGDRLVADGACCAARFADDERHAGAESPAGEFLPVLLLAEMPAMITPECDDGIVAVRSVLQRIEHAAEHGVGEVDRGEVGLDGLLPLALLLDVLEVAIAADLLPGGRHVIEIIRFEAGAGLDGLQRERLEVFLWHKPGLMRSVDAASEEEGLFVFASELLADPLGHTVVAAELLIRHIKGGPVSFHILPGAADRQIHRALRGIEGLRQRIVFRLGGEVVVPRGRVDHVVQQLARASAPVAVIGKVPRHEDGIRQDIAHLLAIVIQARAMRR